MKTVDFDIKYPLTQQKSYTVSKIDCNEERT